MGPARNAHIMCPGNDGLWMSVCMENDGEGFEEYEMLRVLAEKDKASAAAVCEKSFPAVQRRGVFEHHSDVSTLCSFDFRIKEKSHGIAGDFPAIFDQLGSKLGSNFLRGVKKRRKASSDL